MMILNMVMTIMIMMILRNLIQKLLPADFSQEPDVAFKEDFNEGGHKKQYKNDKQYQNKKCDDYDHTDQPEAAFKEDFNKGGQSGAAVDDQDQCDDHGDHHDNHNLTIVEYDKFRFP